MDDRIKNIRKRAKELNLFGHELLDRFSDSKLEFICNGIGPGYFPDTLREKVTRALPHLVLPAAVHDVAYQIGGDLADFRRVNDELFKNAQICAKSEFAWWHPRRYVIIYQGKVLTDLCQRFGFLAWNWGQE